MAQDRVLIRDTDHLSHFASDLSTSLTTNAFADVVLRCAIPGSAGSAGNKGNAKNAKAKTSYPTIRVHRAVLASMSEFMGQLIANFPLEEDIHITLDEAAFEVVKRIIEFAYKGEVKIPRLQVTSVCDIAHRLQIKFLKDSFVKVTDKDYAAMKAGKKSLETLQKEVKGIPRPEQTFKKPDTPSTTTTKKQTNNGKKTSKGGKSKTDSDTDSAESDEEGKNLKVPADAAKVASGDNEEKKKNETPDSVMFTLTKEDAAAANKKVTTTTAAAAESGGKFLVHFKQKKGENQENKAPPVVRTLPTVVPKPISIPSSVASIKKPLPPSELTKVPKVMIPPTVSRPIISLPMSKGGMAIAPPTFTLASAAGGGGGGPSTSQQIISLKDFQVHTIKQPDGTSIQVLKSPGGSPIMKQIKSTNVAATTTGAGAAAAAATAKVKGAKVVSRLPPKDALAIAMEAIAGGKLGIATTAAGVQLPTSPVPITTSKVVLPTNPMPMSGISLPAKPVPINRLKNLSPSKSIIPSAVIKTGGAKSSNAPIAILHPPGFGSSGSKVNVALATATSRHSVSQPKLSIPSTVPDDFLEDSSEASSNSASSGNTGGKNKKAPKGKKNNDPKPTETKATAKQKKENKQTEKAKAVPSTPAAKKATPPATTTTPKNTKEQKEELNSSVRSSGRVRKVNPKYENEDTVNVAPSTTTNSISATKKVAEKASTGKSKKAPEEKTEAAPKVDSSRKRKAAEKPEEEPVQKKASRSNNSKSAAASKSAPDNNSKSASATKSAPDNKKKAAAATVTNARGKKRGAEAVEEVTESVRPRSLRQRKA